VGPLLLVAFGYYLDFVRPCASAAKAASWCIRSSSWSPCCVRKAGCCHSQAN